jgi:hypothetical protein
MSGKNGIMTADLIDGNRKPITADTEIQLPTPKDFPTFTPKPTQAELHILNSIGLHIQDIQAHQTNSLPVYLFDFSVVRKKKFQLQKSYGLKSTVVTCLKVISRHSSI